MDYPDSPDLFEGRFTDGDPVAGIPASVASAEHMNAVYDELKALIAAGGIIPGTGDLAQVSKSIGNQLRSKRLFDVAGTANAIILTTPADKQPVKALANFDEFKFIVSETNTASSVSIKIDGLEPAQLGGVVSSAQLIYTALATVTYIDGFFYLTDQINPRTGNRVSDIGNLNTPLTSSLSVGEVYLDNSVCSRSTFAVLWAKVAQSENFIDQAVKDSDPEKYAAFFGSGDGSNTFTLATIGGDAVRYIGNGLIDPGRELSSLQLPKIPNHKHETSAVNSGDSGSWRFGNSAPWGVGGSSLSTLGRTETTSPATISGGAYTNPEYVIDGSDDLTVRNIAFYATTKY